MVTFTVGTTFFHLTPAPLLIPVPIPLETPRRGIDEKGEEPYVPT